MAAVGSSRLRLGISFETEGRPPGGCRLITETSPTSWQEPELYVCLCKAITDKAVTRAIEEGACSFRAVAATCGAGTVCGGCRPAIMALLDWNVEQSRKGWRYGHRDGRRGRREWR
jgi:bacterioferritin-associated ferredoxin